MPNVCYKVIDNDGQYNRDDPSFSSASKLIPVFHSDFLRDGQLRSPKGAKTEIIRSAIEKTIRPFRIADIQKECPSVSIDLIRQILKKLREEGKVECLERGQSAQWQKRK